MEAFLGDKEIKKKYLTRVRSHELADEIVKGRYWQEGKGCAVGCTIHSSEHKAYEKELGIPEWLARVEDTLFEGMPTINAKKWPVQFLKAINVGANLEQVKVPFIVFILKSSLKSMKSVKYGKKKFPQIKTAQDQVEIAVKEMIRCHERGLDLSAANSAANSAADSAYSAAYSARSAAYSAAYSANSAANSAADSAYSAANSARSAANSAAYSANSAAYSAYSAVHSAAYLAAYLKFSKELLRLLRNCKPKKEKKK